MAVTSLSQVLDISVTVNVNHQRTQEVELYLVAPGGVILNDHPNMPYNNPTQNYTPGGVVLLASHNGGATANFVNTVFTDLARTKRYHRNRIIFRFISPD